MSAECLCYVSQIWNGGTLLLRKAHQADELTSKRSLLIDVYSSILRQFGRTFKLTTYVVLHATIISFQENIIATIKNIVK